MPRLAGQIDVSKTAAILDAAAEVLSVRGVAASMDEIARRAQVSKQTIYNHYGSKTELVRALCAQRVEEMTAGLESPEAALHPEAALASFGARLLRGLAQLRSAAFMRMAMTSVAVMPEIAQAFYEAGPRASRARLADFLRIETLAGRLACPDALEAAEFFAGMVIGSYQSAALLGIERGLDDAKIEALGREAARRFLRAYAV